MCQRYSHRNGSGVWFAGLLLAGYLSFAAAGAVSISGPPLRVEVYSALGAGAFIVPLDYLVWNPATLTASWSAPAAVPG